MAERIPSHHRNFFRGLALCSLALPALLGGTAHGQHADETARQRIRLRAYGMYSYVNPDSRGDTKAQGATIGGDIDGFRLLPHTELGMDARYTFSSATASNQFYFGGGPRLSLELGRFKPYGDFLFGHGSSNFKNSNDPTYTEDKTGAIAYGGGFDYQLTRTWAIRADVQRQRWRFSQNTPYFYPTAISVGASYQFHFRSRTGPDF